MGERFLLSFDHESWKGKIDQRFPRRLLKRCRVREKEKKRGKARANRRYGQGGALQKVFVLYF